MDSINVHLRTLCITWPKFSPKHIWKHLHIVRFFTDCAILFLKQIVLWFSFLVHSWPICRKSLKIFHNTKYIFLEVAGVIIYLWRCTAEKASLYLTCVKKYHYPPINKYVILEEEACAVAADVGIVYQVLTSIFFPSVSRMWRMPCGDAGDLVGINRQRKSKNKPFWSLWGVLVENSLKEVLHKF